MRVVLLATRRGLSAQLVTRLKDELGVLPDDHVAMVSWLRPVEPLPLTTHLLIRPSGAHSARFVATLAPGPTEDDASESPARPDEPGDPVTYVAPGPSAIAMGDGSPGSTSTAAALRHAVGYRVRRVRRYARAGVATVRGSTKVNRVLQRLTPGGLAGQFALAALNSPRVTALVGRADLVLSLDDDTHLAGWVIARRYPRLQAHSGTTGGRRVLAELRDAVR